MNRLTLILIVVITAAYIVLAQLDRSAQEQRDERLLGALATLRDDARTRSRTAEAAVVRLGASLAAFQRTVRDAVEFARSTARTAAALAEPESTAGGEAIDPIEDQVLPPLPDGVSPLAIRTLDVDAFLADPRLNPDHREVDRLTKLRLRNTLTAARHEFERLEGQIHEDLLETSSELDELGEYVLYGPDEPPAPAGRGVLSCAILTPEGSKIFYLDQEAYPAVHETRDAQQEAGRTGIRRAMHILGSAE